ncbi:MAG TPA: DMT family transporter, partial [Cyclobacteriaceae bacterium]|nr:DMT family transporter [Cyclobacteriaceae bacterium]
MASLFDYFKIHVIVFIWGFTAILGLLISIPSVEMVFYRTLIASLGTAALVLIRKQSFSISITDFTKLSATGFLIAAHWIFFFLSARVSNASVSLVGFATIAIWTALLDPIINRKKISWLEVMLGFVVIIGLYIIFQEEVEHSLGLLIGIACGFFGAMFSVINVNFTRRISPYQITLYEMSGATLGIMLFLPIYKIYFASNHTLMLSPLPADWLYLLLLGLV